MTLKNCVQTTDEIGRMILHRTDDGALGIKQKITLAKAQKVYVRIKTASEKLARVRLGVVEDGIWYTEEKIGRGQKLLSVVRSCKTRTVDVIVTVELTDEIAISDFVIETVGDTKIEKRILDKIAYCSTDIENAWSGEMFRLTSENGHVAKKTIKCDLEVGTLYWIKVLTKEITNCGRMWLDCGHSQSPQRGQLVTAFRYAGRMPEFVIKGNKFCYIVEVEAVVVAKANIIELDDFLKKEYWR